jgi:hypothetical protein
MLDEVAVDMPVDLTDRPITVNLDDRFGRHRVLVFLRNAKRHAGEDHKDDES